MKLEKDPAEQGNYTISLNFDGKESISEAGVILGSAENGFEGESGANIVSAVKGDDGSYSVSFSAPLDESVTVQPYTKTEGNEAAKLYETTTIGESAVSNENRFLASGSALIPDSAFTKYTCTAKELSATLETIFYRIWGNEDCILINVTGEASFDEEVLFGQKTIFHRTRKICCLREHSQSKIHKIRQIFSYNAV